MEQAFGQPAVLLANGGSATGLWVPVEDASNTQVWLEADAAGAGSVFIEHAREKTGSQVELLQTWAVAASTGKQYSLGPMIGFIRARSVLSAGNIAAYYNKLSNED